MTDETQVTKPASKGGINLMTGIIGGILLGAITDKMGVCLAIGIALGLIGGGGAPEANDDCPAPANGDSPAQ